MDTVTLPYRVAEATPFTRAFPVTLPSGEVVEATGPGVSVQLEHIGDEDHGAITLRFSTHDFPDGRHPFTPGALVSVAITPAPEEAR